MKKKELRPLTLNRETLKHLDDPALVKMAAGGDPPSSQICCPASN